MRILLTILILIPSYVMGQKEIIESVKLDSLIFEKINDCLITKGVDRFEAFDNSLMRGLSK
jgi:hypothetical protein